MSIYRFRKQCSPDVCKTRTIGNLESDLSPELQLALRHRRQSKTRQLQSGADFVGDISLTYRHTITWTHYTSSIT